MQQKIRAISGHFVGTEMNFPELVDNLKRTVTKRNTVVNEKKTKNQASISATKTIILGLGRPCTGAVNPGPKRMLTGRGVRRSSSNRPRERCAVNKAPLCVRQVARQVGERVWERSLVDLILLDWFGRPDGA